MMSCTYYQFKTGYIKSTKRKQKNYLSKFVEIPRLIMRLGIFIVKI